MGFKGVFNRVVGFGLARWPHLLMGLMLVLPNVALVPYYVANSGVFYALAQLGMACVLLCLPLLFLPVRYWLLAEGIFLLLYPLEMVSLVSIGEPLNFGVYWSIRSVSVAEAIGQMRVYAVPSVLYILSILLYAGCLVWCWRAHLGMGWISRRKRRRFGVSLFLSLLLFPLLAVPLSGYGDGVGIFAKHHYVPKLKALVNATFPVDVLRHTLAYHKARAAMSDALRERPRMDREGVLEDSLRVVGVFILGETSRACNWQLGGYVRDTNPRLSRRDGLFYFTNAYSGANYTQLAAPMLVSCATPRAHDSWLTTPFVTESLRAAGYRTGWITQQSGQELWATLALAGCNYTHIVDTHFPEPIRLDEVLLPFAKAFLSDSAERQFLVMHTYGGHFYYPDRYPAHQAKYRPELPRVGMSGRTYGPSDREVLVNSFDNTIRYTDSILDVVIGMLERDARPSFLVYVPDHGENIFDSEEVGMLHATRTPSHWEQHVPLVVWLSPSYRAAYPDRESALAAHSHLRIQTTATFHTLLHLSNVSCRVWDGSRSLASSDFVPVQDRSVLAPYLDIEPEPPFPPHGHCAGFGSQQ